MKLFKLVALNFVCIVVANRCAFAESMDARFEERYAAWKAWIATNKFRSTYTACKEYYDIVALGVSAVPLIMGKIEKNAEDFHLSSAIKIMTRRRFDKTEWPVEKLGDSKTAAKLYVHWWRVGCFQTGMRFYELYARWSKFNIERELGDADRVYKQIVNLGIPVLPYLIEIIDKSPEFVAAVSILSGDALPKNASLEETKTWWEKNKEQFTLPPAEDVLPQSGGCLCKGRWGPSPMCPDAIIVNADLARKLLDIERVMKVVRSPQGSSMNEVGGPKTIDEARRYLYKHVNMAYPPVACVEYDNVFFFSGGTSTRPVKDFSSGFAIKKNRRPIFGWEDNRCDEIGQLTEKAIEESGRTVP